VGPEQRRVPGGSLGEESSRVDEPGGRVGVGRRFRESASGVGELLGHDGRVAAVLAVHESRGRSALYARSRGTVSRSPAANRVGVGRRLEIVRLLACLVEFLQYVAELSVHLILQAPPL
jgi:hypothetical protein